MKTQKRFVISGMFKTLNILGICLILIALFVPAAHAETIVVDPGAVDGGAKDFAVEATFSEDSPELFVILFTDNKTLEWEAGTHEWLTPGSPSSLAYAGFLLDASGNPIPGTELVGKTQKENDPVPFGVINLSERTVFSGILLTSSGFSDSYVFLDWNWDDNDRPVVGETQASGNQPPLANAGADVTGQVGVPVDFDGSDSSDPDGEITLYTWDFVETIANDAGPTPSHIFTASGTYNVVLSVTDDGFQGNQSLALGDSDSVTVTIAPNSVPPVADAGGPYTGVKDVQFFFDGSASDDPDGSIVQYDWDFDDGSGIAFDVGPAPNHRYTSSGEFFVTLAVTDDSGEMVTDTATITVLEGNLLPVADAGLPVVGNSNEAVVFDGSGSSDPDGEIVQYDWNFGDGNSLFDGGPTPSHVYTAPGDYTVYLAVTDNLNAITSALTSASINAGGASLTPTADAPTADAGGPYAGVVNQPVILDGSASDDPDGNIVQYDWDFDDGNTGSGLFAIHTYTASGVYTARLTVTDDSGVTDDSNAIVIVGDGSKLPPRADANGPYNGVVGVPVTFDGSKSTDPDGNITAWDWDFGDNNTGNGPVPDNTYTAGGLYSVILQVTDNDALTASDGTIARIGNLSLPPNADANDEPYKGRVGVPVAFDGGDSSDPDGDIVRYDWDFGDGSIGNDAGATPTNVYATGGKYIARLTVTDDSGETDTDITVVNVGIGNLPPQPDAGGVVSGKVGRAITFDGTASRDPDGSVANYAWSFGDGNTATRPNPTHSYAAAGKYFVTLSVTDNDGLVSSDVTLADVEQSSGGGGGGGSCFITTAMGK